MNDPIPFYHAGQLHLFYQATLDAAAWSRKFYGHSVSRDGWHFETRPDALTPGSPCDALHCYTGSVIAGGDGNFYCFYTGVNADGQNIALAVSSDLDRWHKSADNPQLTAPAGYDTANFRDPCVYRENGVFRMLAGARNLQGGSEILRYSSPDLKQWHPEGVFYRDAANSEFFECPDYFELDGKKILLFSRNGRTFIAAGQEIDDRFVPEKIQSVEAGGRSFYAGKSYADDAGRRFLIGWIPAVWSPEVQQEAGWGSLQSVPLELRYRDGGFRFTPLLPPELPLCLAGNLAADSAPIQLHLSGNRGRITLAPGFLEVKVDESHYHRPFVTPRDFSRVHGDFSGAYTLRVTCDRNIVLVDWNHEIIWIEPIWSE